MARKRTSGKPTHLKIKQVRSGVGKPEIQRKTLRALGLRHHQDSVTQPDNAAIRGMVFQVRHLIEVTEVAEGEE